MAAEGSLLYYGSLCKSFMDSSPYILIGGDIAPTVFNEAVFRLGAGRRLLGDQAQVVGQAELSVFNWECPLVNGTRNGVLKTGPALAAHPECARAVEDAGIKALVLANNHIRDHGDAGVRSTLETLGQTGCRVLGGGLDLDQARQPFTAQCGSYRIGVVAMAEHEWSIAGLRRAGANPLDLIGLVRLLQSKDEAWDKVILILHGGSELYAFPSPRMLQLSRFLAEQGADAVVWQHSHCAGCLEEHAGCTIVYGQGNAIFWWPGQPRGWYEGFMLKLQPRPQPGFNAELRPFAQVGPQAGLRALQGEERRVFLSQLDARSLECRDPANIAKRWAEFCRANQSTYLGWLLGHSRLFEAASRFLPGQSCFCSKRRLAVLLNALRCETHREASLKVLEQTLNI